MKGVSSKSYCRTVCLLAMVGKNVTNAWRAHNIMNNRGSIIQTQRAPYERAKVLCAPLHMGFFEQAVSCVSWHLWRWQSRTLSCDSLLTF